MGFHRKATRGNFVCGFFYFSALFIHHAVEVNFAASTYCYLSKQTYILIAACV